ncbi:Glycolate dehydrogenase, iron-sulfur subunit GlcF [hydrothermal vent metagenome]|uniref:Glycolate dehydrogenase, iron-sulfur subunit GlcF n=1 Tax=hydrothermal vent metagenome TaxID=652676 RepID=A0A3B1A409_9ZZZZ
MQLKQKIDQLTDQCVKCGMCLPSCPTYQLSKNENESPRGRIALMQGIVKGELSLSPNVIQHLDHCLGCLSCEKICPSKVEYETLIDAIREYTVTENKISFQEKLISFLIKPTVQNNLFSLLRFYQRSGIQKLLRFAGLLKLIGLSKQEQLLPKLYTRLKLQPSYSAKQNSLGSVALFTGCMGQHFEQAAIVASIKVLTQLGYDVEIPKQVCCGALHQHSGFRQQADALAKTNARFLLNKSYQAILFTASGCGAQLKTSLQQDQVSVSSLMDFILQHTRKHPVSFARIEQAVAVHQPCSLQNTLKQSDAVILLLSKIPQLEIIELQSQCCGAAGKNMLSQTKLANQIRQPLLEQIQQTSADVVVSSNIGCALHLTAGLQSKRPVIHPIELIAESLQ